MGVLFSSYGCLVFLPKNYGCPVFLFPAKKLWVSCFSFLFSFLPPFSSIPKNYGCPVFLLFSFLFSSLGVLFSSPVFLLLFSSLVFLLLFSSPVFLSCFPKNYGCPVFSCFPFLFSFSVFLFCFPVFLFSVSVFRSKSGSTALDVGCHEGAWILPACWTGGAGIISLLIALWKRYRCVKALIRCRGIELLQLALSSGRNDVVTNGLVPF